MTDELNRPEDPVEKPCIVEAFEGAVVVECGTSGTSLTPSVARDAGKRMVKEADRAEQDVDGQEAEGQGGSPRDDR